MFERKQQSAEIADQSINAMPDSEHAICFASFRLFPVQRLLLESQKPLRIGSRALDILIALVERPGELVSKEELMARVWPNTFVEPANLTVHIAALRRILCDGRGGNRFLINIPGRGYRFVTPIKVAEQPTSAPALFLAAERMHSVPAQVTRLRGRDDAKGELSSLTSRAHFLGVSGSDGDGKTLAASVAEELLENYKHGILLIETFLRKAS